MIETVQAVDHTLRKVEARTADHPVRLSDNVNSRRARRIETNHTVCQSTK
jgi:hypothetical protein